MSGDSPQLKENITATRSCWRRSGSLPGDREQRGRVSVPFLLTLMRQLIEAPRRMKDSFQLMVSGQERHGGIMVVGVAFVHDRGSMGTPAHMAEDEKQRAPSRAKASLYCSQPTIPVPHFPHQGPTP